jgi:hypothetical protein
MNREIPHPADRAWDLAFARRHRALSPDEEAFLATFAVSHPQDHQDLVGALSLAEHLRDARVEARPEFYARLNAAIAGWVREDRRDSPPRAAPSPAGGVAAHPVGRWVHFLFGRDSGVAAPSWPTVIFGRSLAAYLGVAATLCVHFALAGDPAPAASEFRAQPRTAAIEGGIPSGVPSRAQGPGRGR